MSTAQSYEGHDGNASICQHHIAISEQHRTARSKAGEKLADGELGKGGVLQVRVGMHKSLYNWPMDSYFKWLIFKHI